MKNLLIVLGVIVLLVAVTWFVFTTMAGSAEKRADQAFNKVEPDAAFEKRYPEVGSKNESAQQLEQVAMPLVDFRSAKELATARNSAQIDPKIAESMSNWLTAQMEQPNDDIAALPPDLSAWLAANAATIDAVTQQLVAHDAPNWPLTHSGDRMNQPLPNLLAHMRMFRVLCMASLEAETRGDHAKAWEYQHAAWQLIQGLYQRPEMISRLIAVAGVRLSAATLRKLEPPAPAWANDLLSLHLRAGMYDSLRYEMTTSRLAIQTSPSFTLSDEEAGPGERIAMTITRPVIKWAMADVVAVAADEFSTASKKDLCAFDAAASQERVRTNVTPLARHFGLMVMPNLAASFGRAAIGEMAIEGTRAVLALKTARDASTPPALPPTFTAPASACKGASWQYTYASADQATLKFTGNPPRAGKIMGVKIPTEFVAKR
jgi:hypothetical protein